ncbi:MAG: carbohydrate ABC transporter permease [Clostridia bacterium]|nr:carbohydrate ABC transporter permease [Clostridia bacterium]
MRKISSEDARRVNHMGFALCLAAVIFIAIIMAMPFYDFTTSIFSKRSGNTFVGDERYLEAKAEMDAALETFESRDIEGELLLSEQVTQRVNSKGETTSMVAFSINLRISRTGYDFLASDLPAGTILRFIIAFALIAALLALASMPSGMDTSARDLGKAKRLMRGMACWLALAALILVPVMAMNNNYVIERQVIPNIELETELEDSLNSFLYEGHAEEDLEDMVKGLSYGTTPWLWMMMAAAAAMLAGLILLLRGALGRTLARGGLYLFAIALSVLILYPYYVMFITAFRSNAETTDMYFTHMLPTNWVWTNIIDIANRGVPRFLLNSLLLSGGATGLALLCGIPAAYAMARMRFKGKKAFLGFIIMSQMFAPVVLLVGISRLMNTLHLNDTIVGLMFINAAFNQAFAIWLLRGTFVSISSEMEQAACIDGCSTVGALVRVLLPMAAPGIVTTLIFVFINAWNEYTISTVLISTPTKKPITVGITQFSSFNMIEWQYLFASSLLATIPVIIMFMCIEKHLVSGLTSGGVKG